MDRQVTIQQAALELGISEKTVRRRLKAGQLSGQLIDSKWSIVLPITHSSPEPDQNQALKAEIEALRAERDWLRALTEQLSITNANLVTAMRNLEVLALPAPLTNTPTTSLTSKRHWWQVWIHK